MTNSETLAPAPESARPLIPTHPVNPALHRRNGKVARLPAPARETVNTMLRDGATYAAVIAKLAEQGHPLTPNNLSRWHRGGYQDWLQQQACLDEMRLKFDFAGQVVNQKNVDLLTEAGLRIAVVRLYNFLLDFDPADLKPSVAACPSLYPRLLNSLCKLTDGALKHHRYRDELDALKPIE